MNKSTKVYPFDLKLNCRKMQEAQMYELANKIVNSPSEGYINTQIIEDDTIFVKGAVTDLDYNKIWDVLAAYNAIVD